ncbi:MAG: serine/threonine-protein kinase [Polyangiaceae bacterium]
MRRFVRGDRTKRWPGVVIAAGLAATTSACAGEPDVPLAEWQRTRGDAIDTVVLPARVPVDRSPGPAPVLLRRSVELGPSERRGRFVLRWSNLQTPMRLRVDGREVRDEHDDGPAYRARGSHVFVLPDDVSEGKHLLEVTVEPRWERATWFDAVPTISGRPESSVRSSLADLVENGSATLAVVVLVLLAALHGAFAALRRTRPEGLWFATLALVWTSFPIFVSGVLAFAGPAEGLVFAVLQPVSAFLGLGFSTSKFEGKAPSLIHVLPSVALAVSAPFVDLFALGPFTMATSAAVAWAAAAHARVLVRATKRSETRPDAVLLLAGWVGSTTLTALFDVGWFGPRTALSPLPFHVGSSSLVALAVVHVVALGREHVAVVRRGEVLARRVDVLERARTEELAGAVARLVTSPELPELRPGDLVDERFRVVGRLGQGGMGTVYEAVRQDDGVAVALKVLRGESDGLALRRLAREAAVGVAFDHPNLVRVLFSDVSKDGRLYVAMELVRGRAFAPSDWRRAHVDAVVDLLAGVASGLAALHAANVVHRDVKPSNVLVVGDPSTGASRVLLTDYGLARRTAVTSAEPSLGTTETASTFVEAATGACEVLEETSVAGTPRYMAPELARSEPTASSDVFAWGVLAFECLSGVRPFDEDPIRRAFRGDAFVAAKQLLASTPDVPVPIAEIVGRSLQGDATRRPAAVELVAALRPYGRLSRREERS